MKITLATILQKSSDQLSTDIGAETLMMRVENGRYYSVDGPGQAIWDLIDGQASLQQIVETLVAKYDVEKTQCEAETLEFATALKTEDLVVALC